MTALDIAELQSGMKAANRRRLAGFGVAGLLAALFAGVLMRGSPAPAAAAVPRAPRSEEPARVAPKPVAPIPTPAPTLHLPDPPPPAQVAVIASPLPPPDPIAAKPAAKKKAAKASSRRR